MVEEQETFSALITVTGVHGRSMEMSKKRNASAEERENTRHLGASVMAAGLAQDKASAVWLRHSPCPAVSCQGWAESRRAGLGIFSVLIRLQGGLGVKGAFMTSAYWGLKLSSELPTLTHCTEGQN